MPRRTRSRDNSVIDSAPVLPVRDAVLFPGQIHTLHVAREGSKRAIRAAMLEAKPILVVSQRDHNVEDPASSDLQKVGTLCEALQAVPLPDGSIRLALRCLERAESKRITRRGGVFHAVVERIADIPSDSLEADALMRSCVDLFSDILEKSKKIPPEAIDSVVHQESAGSLADAIAHHLPLRPSQKQELLEELDVPRRLQMVYELLRREERILLVQSEISERVDREFATSQREMFLREQLRAVQFELDAIGGESSETQRIRDSIVEAQLPSQAHESAMREVAHLERAAPNSPEAMVIRNYVEWMVSLPWAKSSPDRLDVKLARKTLDEAHFGLHQVKDRILDFLAVRQVSQSLRGPILCFIGPPGVGKTSVGRSIADALGREFVRISLGGLRDEAEIRGHRRTYVGAMPGRILQSLRQCGTRNPVMVLDEIDKMSSDFRGDPSSALLEALDPAQNERFSDHFIEAPFDLSSVLFIATANLAENIPAALLDRMEIVRFTSYTDEERLRIAERFLAPRQMEAHGLSTSQLTLSHSALKTLVQDYSREAGVRELERAIATVCRKAARRIAEGKATKVRATSALIEKLIGPSPHITVARLARGEVGSANSMVVTSYGGELIPIEALLLEAHSGGPNLRLTGNLGTVMRESAEAALSFIRSHREKLAPDAGMDRDVHIHVPDNAVPKEGPSAGLTVAVALASALTQRSVRGDLAMTGEITLGGKVLPVGGIREKLVAAARSGIGTIILPAANQVDLGDVPKEVLSKLDIRLVETVDEAIAIALMPVPTRAVVSGASKVPIGRPAP